MTLLLGLDVGTTSVKAGLFDASGTRVSSGSREYRIAHPLPDRAELDPETYWSASIAAIRQAFAEGRADPRQLVAIAVSSQGETVIPVDEAGAPLGPALVWLDNRAGLEAVQLAERFSDAVVYDRTGVPSVNATWTAPKIMWWRRNEPELFARTRRFLLVEDFILHRLSGRFVTDGGIRCTTMLYDIRTDRWWDEMLEAVGVDAGRLPEIIRPGSVVGNVTAAAAETLGIPRSVLVIAGGMDQGVGAVGVGNVTSGAISESTGGALTVQATVDRHGLDRSRQTPVYVHSAPDRYLYCPVCPTGGMALTWFRDQFGGEEVARAAREGRSAYDLLTEFAAQAPAGSEGLTMLPHLMGAFSPEYDPKACGVFYGFTLHHGKPHFVRAVLESVAFMLRKNLELLAGAGAEASEIRSHGGGARSPLWNQIKADVCGLPVVTLEGEDAAVRGDAMLAGVATGIYPTLVEASAAMVVAGDRYEPDPAVRGVYEASYARYGRLFDALQPIFDSADSPAGAGIPG